MSPDDTDLELALRCLQLAAGLWRLDVLTIEQRDEVLAETIRVMQLLAEVFLEPQHEPSRN